MDRTLRQSVELFHLHFLRQLCSGPDRARFTLKGGCNLRFFFGSIRYSENMDLDVSVMTRTTLKNKVDRLLDSPALRLPLKTAGITLIEVTGPKQTETTQRWKMGLLVKGQSAALRTKVEFSRRDADEGEVAAVEAMPAELPREYGLPPPVVNHYLAIAATTQKIRALIGRPQTQARDVFDLQLLRSKSKVFWSVDAALTAELPTAIERVLSLSYDDYVSQVVAYLAPEQLAASKDRQVWDAMQLEVVELLQGLRR